MSEGNNPPRLLVIEQHRSNEDRCTLDEGACVIVWPKQMSAISYEEFEYFLQGVLNRAKRLSTKETP